MTNKKPNYIIEFDGKEYLKEEQTYLIFVFCKNSETPLFLRNKKEIFKISF